MLNFWLWIKTASATGDKCHKIQYGTAETDMALWYDTGEDTPPVKQDISQLEFSAVF